MINLHCEEQYTSILREMVSDFKKTVRDCQMILQVRPLKKYDFYFLFDLNSMYGSETSETPCFQNSVHHKLCYHILQ